MWFLKKLHWNIWDIRDIKMCSLLLKARFCVLQDCALLYGWWIDCYSKMWKRLLQFPSRCVQTFSLVLYMIDVYKVMVSMQYVTTQVSWNPSKDLEDNVRFLIVYRHSFWTTCFEIVVFLFFFFVQLVCLIWFCKFLFLKILFKWMHSSWAIDNEMDLKPLISYSDFIYNH